MASNLYNKCADIKAKLDGILLKTDSIINSGLPYVELEYIESTGTQYIILNYLTKNNTGFEIATSITSGTGANLFGAGNSSNQHPYFNLRDNLCRYSYSNGGESNMITFANTNYGNKQIFKLVNDNGYKYYYNGTQLGTISLSHPVGANWVLFTYRESNGNIRTSSTETAKCKLYNMVIYEGASVVMNLIPVIRKSDSVVCMYDLIGGQFYENAGTGTFIAGPTVKGRLPNLNTDELLLQLYGNNITSNTTWTNLINSSNLTVSNGVRDESTNSMTFNGSSTIIDTGIAQSTLSSGYTMVLRFLPNSWTNYKGLFGLHDTSGENGIVGLQYQDGNIYFGHRNNGNKSVAVSSSKLSTNTWHIAICKFDGTYLYLYIDGTYIGKTSSNTPLTPTGNVIIGKSYNGGDRFFYGKISDILLYKRAITDGEIDYIFKNI